MKDEALRASILITANAYKARGDQAGNLMFAALNAILHGAEVMDEALAVPAIKRRGSKLPSTPLKTGAE